MVEIDKIISERSDEKILKSVKDISDAEFAKLVETILGYLDLKMIRTRAKGTFEIVECLHRPDGKKYIVFFSRRNETITKADIESLVAHMAKIESPNGLVLTAAAIEKVAIPYAESQNVGLADGAKLAALLRRFDLDKEVLRMAESRRERARAVIAPGADKELQDTMLAGYEALSNKDFMKALDIFDRAIMIKEDYDLPWRLKGNTLDEMGYHEQALECYKRALDLYPESDETWFSLGSCLFSLGRYNEELMCYDRALHYNPLMQKALINRGSTLHRLGRYKEALDTYDKVLKINYRLEKVHNNRGATLHSLGQLNDALSSYNRAIELRHDYVEAWMNKGSLLYEMGRYGEALQAFTEMTRIRPELPKGWYLRGLAAKKTGDVTKAKASFEASLRLDPDYSDAKRSLEEITRKISEKYTEVPRIVQDIFSSEAAKGSAAPPPPPVEATARMEDHITRVREERVEELAEELYGDKAEVLLLLGRFDEAFDFLGKSLRLEGENASLLTSAANVLYKLGKLQAAAKTYEHALELDPKYFPALLNLQTVQMEEGESQESAKASEHLRKHFTGWYSLASASLEALSRKDLKCALDDVDSAIASEALTALENYKGLLLLRMGQLDPAMKVFEKTRGLAMDQAEAHNNTGMVYLKKGDLEKASAEFDRSIKTQRNHQAGWNNRGCVLYKLERLREAIACFDESVVLRKNTVALSNKGFSQLGLDLLKEALNTFEQSIKVAETAEAYNNKGIVLERMGRHADAVVAFKEALRIEPQFKDATDNMNRVSQLASKAPEQPAETKHEPPPPGEEIVGEKESTSKLLQEMTEPKLLEKRKAELESMCEALGISTRGTRADLISRLMKAKAEAEKKG